MTTLAPCDELRLASIRDSLYELMRDGQRRTLREMHTALGRGSETAISAKWRELTWRHGYPVGNSGELCPSGTRWMRHRARRGDPADGVWEYWFAPIIDWQPGRGTQMEWEVFDA